MKTRNLLTNGTLLKSDKGDAHRSPRSLRMENLEGRRLMAVFSDTYIDDMTDLAAQYAEPDGPTDLWINFEGNAANGVTAFQGTSAVQRNADIQEILFHTSEIFAPFDVRVRRRFGNGISDTSSNGNTTVFVGDHPTYTRTDIFGNVTNGRGAFTPWASTDYPNNVTGIDHLINSNDNDTAFADPWNGASNQSNLAIAQVVAHEAGHTFGLAHVLSSPQQEVMSYDATNRAFRNTTLNVTNLNATGAGNVPNDDVQPKWHTTLNFFGFKFRMENDIVTQNSYTTLMEVLGPRSRAGDYANVAEENAVDPGYSDAFMRWLDPVRNVESRIGQEGDYDVYDFDVDSTGTYRVQVDGINSSFLIPTVMVYDTATNSIRQIDVDSGVGQAEAEFRGIAGRTYHLIVGARDGNSTGDYRISLDVGASLGSTPRVNLDNLANSRDGRSDRVYLRVDDGQFSVKVNSTIVYSDQVDDITSGRIEGSSDNETFYVDDVIPFSLRVYGNSGTDRIRGPYHDNQWRLTGSNFGYLNSTVTFVSMENITGGSRRDNFKIGTYGRLSGTLSGGGSTDTIDYSARSTGVTVDLGSRTATSINRLWSIENATGSRASDTLIGDSGANVLKGGNGNDILRGRAGRDQLFGELGQDQLFGGAGSDLLDGGFDRVPDLLWGDRDSPTSTTWSAEVDTLINHVVRYGSYWYPEDIMLEGGDNVSWQWHYA